MSADHTGIAWTDATWNPTRGCSRVSEGCRNCYAERMGARLSGPGRAYEGLVRLGERGPRWTGKVMLVPAALDQPLRWKRGRRIFVNSMSDLFHESLTDEEIASVFGVMAATPQHTFQVLTKRAERMAAWFARNVDHATECGEYAARFTGDSFASYSFGAGGPWPLPNVWIGTSVERQEEADERIPHLLATPAAVRFLSVEPLLGPVDLDDLIERDGKGEILGPGEHHFGALTCDVDPQDDPWSGATVGWVIIGGESGPGARSCDLAWIRSVVGQCKAAGVPVFVKQLGAHVTWNGHSPPGGAWPPGMRHEDTGTGRFRVLLTDRKGGDLAEFPPDLQIREFPIPRST